MKSRSSIFRSSRDPRIAIILIVAMLSPTGAMAQQPQAGQVVRGDATIATPSASSTVITQTSQRAIIDWKDFSIGAGGVVRIQQPGAAAALLNRVIGGNLSAINGQLQANGRVFLINPHGIVVGPNGTIDTAAFIGSTLNTSNEEFMAGGAANFTGVSSAAIVNLGTIKTSAGDVVLVAPRIANAGTIDAPGGTAALLAGREVLYVPGSGSLLIRAAAPTGDGGSVENTGLIRAAEVALKAAGTAYGLAVNNGGAISATSMSRVGGRILLDGGAGDVSSSGSLTATAGDTGGRIDVTGANVGLTGDAIVDASGRNGGGAIRIGGGFRGQDAEIDNATTTTVGDAVTIRASAIESGNAGTVAVWSNESTTFQGRIEARGAETGGNGGNAEVSGHVLNYSGVADLRAPSGSTGELLLDPGSFVIDAAQAATIQNNLNTANVTIDSPGIYDDITVSSPVTNNTTANTLTLDANNIFVNSSISLQSGTVQFGANFVTRNSVTSAAGASIAANLISVNSSYSSVNFAGPLMTPVNGLSISRSAAGAGSFTASNAANQIKNLYLNVGAANAFTGVVDIRSSVATKVTGTLNSSADVTVVSAGDLAFDTGCGGSVMTVGGTTTLASTGGVFNSGGNVTLNGAGRKRIYSSTTNAPFNVSGLVGYTQYTGVSFGSDPQAGNVIYIAAGVALPILTITADNKSMTYGAFEPTYTASFSGGTAGNLTSPVQFRLDRAQRDVGTYVIIPFGATSATHQLSFVNGTLTVTPAPLLITGPTVTSPYGSAFPAFTPQFTGLVNGDGPSAVAGLRFDTPATTRSPVGTYPIIPSGGTSNNYVISYANGQLTITPAVLRVIANNASRLYGAANPLFSASYSGLMNGDTPAVVSGLTLSTTASERSGVGTYPIVGSGGTAANYTLEYVPGTLTVDRAPLSIATTNAIVTYGNAPPTLTNSVTGLVAGDTVASLGINYTTSVVPGTGVGTYPTTLVGSFANYQVSYTPGSITVSPRTLFVVANDAKRFQFEANPAFTAKVSGLFGSDTVNGLRFSTVASPNSPAGTYAVTPATGPMPNYLIVPVDGTLTVEQAPTVIITTGDLTNLNVDVKKLLPDLNAPPTSDIRVNFGGTQLSALLNNSPGVIKRVISIYESRVKDAQGTGANLLYLMRNNLSGANNEVGQLLPFLIGEAKDILDRDPSTWSNEEQKFIAYMTEVMSQQRKDAADDAAAQLAEWKMQQKLDAERQGVVSLISTQPVPPDKFLQQVQSGISTDYQASATYAGLLTAAAGTVLVAGASAVAVGVGVTGVVTTIFPFAVTAAAASHTASVAASLAAGEAVSVTAAGSIGASAGAILGAALVVVLMVTAGVVTAVNVANAGDYDKKMAEATAAAQKPMTAADLKAMLSTEGGQKTAFLSLVGQVAKNAGDKKVLTGK